MNKPLFLALSALVLAFSVWVTYTFGAYGSYLGIATLFAWCVEFVTHIPSMIISGFHTWMECKCPANATVVDQFEDLLKDE